MKNTKKNIKKLTIGTEVYYDYSKVTIYNSYVPSESRIIIKRENGDTNGPNIKKVFFPTKHVEAIAKMVSEERKKFDESTRIGDYINPNIYNLFENHWINMCNSRTNRAAFEQAKNEFYMFVSELKKVDEIVFEISVSQIPYLKRF